MSYANLTDLIDRAGADEIRQVADRDLDGQPDPAVTDAALTHADNLVNGYVRARYALPLSPVPDLVRTWAVSIARYWLHNNGAPEYVEADYKDAIAALKDVARGAITLPVSDGTTPEAASGVHVAIIPPENFTPEKLRGW